MQRFIREVAGPANARLLRLARRTRASSTASRPRTRATCRPGPTWSTRASRYLAEMATRLHRRIPLGPAGPPRPSTPCCRAAATTRRMRGHPLAGGLQSDPLHGTARTVHGVHLQHDRQIALHHGAGSEGALTKGPFNALPPIIDLNNALVSLSADRHARLHHRGRLCRAARARGSRRQPAGARNLVPHDGRTSATRSS